MIHEPDSRQFPRARARAPRAGARACGRARAAVVGHRGCEPLLTRADTVRAEDRPWWSRRGRGGGVIAAVAAAWLSSRRRAALGGSCFKVPQAVSPVVVRFRPRPEQTSHDVGRQPALSRLSIRPLFARHRPVAYRATAWLDACPDWSDSLHFVVCPVLLQVASRAPLAFPSCTETPLGLRASCVKSGSRRL